MDAKAFREKMEALYKGVSQDDKSQDDKYLLGRELTGIKNAERWASMSEEEKNTRVNSIRDMVKERQQDPNYHKKLKAAMQSEERKKKISEASKETWKKQGTKRVKNIVAKKKQTGSIVSDETIMTIYNDPDGWDFDRLYGAGRRLANKHNVDTGLALRIMQNGYNQVSEEEHNRRIQEWKDGPAEKFVMYSPSVKWLELYDDFNAALGSQQKSHMPPSDVWKARQLGWDDGYAFLLEKYNDIYGGGKVAKEAVRRALRNKFLFLIDQEPQRYVFYTLEEAKSWVQENIEGIAKTANIGRFFLDEGKNVAWKAPGLRGWVFERENRNAKGQHRHKISKV